MRANADGKMRCYNYVYYVLNLSPLASLIRIVN